MIRFLFLAFCLNTQAFAGLTLEEAKSNLQEQLNLLDKITPFIMRYDEPRLYVLKKSNLEVINSIDKNGLHMITLSTIQTTINRFRHSRAYFDRISMENTSELIKQLIIKSDTIAKDFGIDDDPYTHFIQITFKIIKENIDLLLDSNPSDELREAIQDILPLISNTLVAASTGDRPKAFFAGREAYNALEATNPIFYKIQSASSNYKLVLEIQGQAQLFSEYAQTEWWDEYEATHEKSDQ